MSFDYLLNQFGNSIEGKLNGNYQTAGANEFSVGNYSIDSSIFAGADINSFKEKIAQGMNFEGNESIFYQAVNNAGVENIFDSFDTNGDGIIDEDEIRGIASTDGNEKDISNYDMEQLTTKNAYDMVLDNYREQMDEYRAQEANKQAMQNYTSNIGGDNYQNYGSQTQNGSTISSPEQYTTKEKLENIENTEIPELEEKKQEIINNAQTEIDGKNEELNNLLEENKEELEGLDEQYKNSQKEINTCDEKIREKQSELSQKESEKFGYESTLSNLEAELAALDTNTGDEEIDTANKQRKTEIENEIKELKDKIQKCEDDIDFINREIESQKSLKGIKQDECNGIQEKIAQINPELAEKMQAIKDEITQIETQRDEDVAEIDEQIEAKQQEAIEYQKEIGTRTGEAESMTGSKMVQDALKLAQQELEKGVYEYTGKNDSPEIDKYRNGLANGDPWCASFVSWIYGAGQNSDNAATFGYDASVAGIRSDAQNAGYYATVGTYTPQPGDLMIQENNASHVGIVTGVDPDGTIHTIEGNSSNKVSQCTYTPGSSGYNMISGWVQMNEWLSK